MPWAKLTNKKFLLVLLFIFVFLLTRLPNLWNDTINPDGVSWHKRSELFVVALKSGNFINTYQHYHPGVTLMWIMGPVVEIAKHVTGQEIYNNNSFQLFDYISKFSLVVVQLILSLLLLFVFSKIMGFMKAIAFIMLLSLEPFFVGNSRLVHLDVLLTLFLLLGLGFNYLSFQDKKYNYSVLAGIFYALSFLTKSIGLGGLVFGIFYGIYLIVLKKEFKVILKMILLQIFTFVVTTFILFPALWVKPFFVLNDMFTEGSKVALVDGHKQIVLGEETDNAGTGYYPLVLLMKVSPFTIFGILLFVLYLIQNIKNTKPSSFLLFLFTFSVGYFLVMLFPSKKIDRYMLPLFPFLSLIAIYGFEKFYPKYKYIIALLFLIFVVLPLVVIFPYYFTYTSPVLGSPKNANSLIGQKPFGIGMYSLKDLIINKYKVPVNIGMLDTKPLSSIYPNSKVYDMRVTGPRSYDVYVLGINEVLPDKVTDSPLKFRLVDSIYINGLEYWRIYEKNR